MNILDEIIAHKHLEVAQRKEQVSVSTLEKSPLFTRPTLSLKAAILNPQKTGIIAEHKRKSPSKGIINPNVTIEDVTRGYVQGGASGLSVLTDTKYFDGSDDHLLRARQCNPETPILRKDFIIDEYQILEARSLGADVILLIAANLSTDLCLKLAAFAHSLQLEVLLEVHNLEELTPYLDAPHVDMLGVNNRNLKTMKTDLDTSRQLSAIIPDRFVKISESGIHTPEILAELKRDYGYQGFLMGEYFMQHPSPGQAFAAFVASIPVIS